MLTLNEFLKLSKKGNLIPVYKEIVADLETPVSAYFKVCAKAKHSFLLESVEGEEKISQFSFLAKDPELILETKDKSVTITHFKNGKSLKTKDVITNTPLDCIRSIMRQYTFVPVKGLPRFCGGLVGYGSYDLVRFFEKLPDNTTDDLQLPDTLMALVKNLIIFDHRNHKIKIVSCASIKDKATQKDKTKAYNKAIRQINAYIKELNTAAQPANHSLDQKKASKLKVKSNMTAQKYKQMVNTAKKQIRAGEIIQAVLSQRFEIDLKTDPFNIYRTLRVLNPSPYMYFLKFNDLKIIGSSPELLVRCDNGVVETRPIAGTRPRGKDDKEDQRYAEDLLADPKEIAEHIMLVDLGRNDLGRVCQKGTVEVSEFMIVEKYSHVMHIVSNVKGRLKKNKDDFDVLQAAFPAGTLSGAPKIRAMEIIDELEPTKRGPYGGCIGYFSFSGNVDTCITIRTVVAKKNKAYIQAGAGIVADSNPQKEYLETVNKAKAAIRAIELAHQ